MLTPAETIKAAHLYADAPIMRIDPKAFGKSKSTMNSVNSHRRIREEHKR